MGGVGWGGLDPRELVSTSRMNTSPGNLNLKVICLRCEVASETKEMHYSSGPGGGVGPPPVSVRCGADPIGREFTPLHLRVQLIFVLLFHRRKLERLKSSEHEMQNQLKPADV